MADPSRTASVGDRLDGLKRVGLPASAHQRLAQQVWVDPVLWVRLRRPGPLEDRLQAQAPHQAPDSLAADPYLLAPEPACHLPRAVERRLQKLLVNSPQQLHIEQALVLAFVVERRAGDRYQPTLAGEAERDVIRINHRDPPAVVQRPKALDKKSRSITSSPTFARNSLISTSRAVRTAEQK